MENLHRTHLISSLFHLLQLLTLFLSLSLETLIFFSHGSFFLYLLPITLILLLLLPRNLTMLLLDFSCLPPSPQNRIPTAAFIEHASLIDSFDDRSVAFMSKIISSSAMGEETCLPPSLHFLPPRTSLLDCLDEARMLIFPTLDDLFSKTGVPPLTVDVLVLNCSGFCPAPSLSAMIVNHYAMRQDIKSFNLSGMGCSAGAIAVDVAVGALRACGTGRAVTVSTEIVSTGWYAGKDPRKLLLNCFFRMGCSAVLLTNRREDRRRSKYKLLRLLRTQRAFDDRAYRSAIREEDEQGITGFSIERDLLRVAGETLRTNIAAVGPSILPATERLRYAVLSLLRTARKGVLSPVTVEWRKAIQHFCLPAAGRAVMEEIRKGLGLVEEEVEAAAMTFHRFGNQSSAAMWYQLAYEEAKGRVEKGERVWQLAMGSGPKCNTVVWECLRRPEGEAERGPWAASICRYPVEGCR